MGKANSDQKIEQKVEAVKLAPCPFCSESDEGDNLIYVDGPEMMNHRQTYAVECQICGSKGPWSYTANEAARGWNKRGA